MMKHEFENLAKTTVNDADYEIIEKVYAFHPAIPDVDGKKVIITLWNIGGIGLMFDMYDTAQHAASLEHQIQAAKMEVSAAESKLRAAQRDFSEFRKLPIRPSAGIADTIVS